MKTDLSQTGPNFKRIIITSIPGSDWDEIGNVSYVNALKEKLAARGLESEIHNVREILYRVANEEHIALNPTKIHNFSSDKKIRLLRRLAFGEIEKALAIQEAQKTSSITIIRTRATSFSAHGKEESLRLRYLQRIKPDLLVVVIDDPAAIYDRIPKHPDTKKYASLKIDDLVVWLEDEVADMQELAWDLDCQLFVMPRRQVSALVDLIMTDKKAAYVSYAMTVATEEVKRQKDELVDVLSNHFVVFDPECMGTAHTNAVMTDDEQSTYRDDVIMRDENWFIDINSKYVIVYLPEKGPAHGSQSELHTASEEFKTVLVALEPSYSDEKGKLTPFIDRRAETVFISAKELGYYLELNTDEEKVIYSHVVKSMWGFKRRGGLSPLVELPVDGSLQPPTENEVRREFVHQCLNAYREQSARGVLPVLDESKVLDMGQRCWNFNKPLWAKEKPAGKILRLPMEIPERTDVREAAREPAIASSNVQTGQSDVILPTDDEAFTGVFRRLALTPTAPAWRDNLFAFFQENTLGNLGSNLGFLRFLKRTLDAHKYKSPESFSATNLREWFREFNRGVSTGSKL